jgi:hypothetical protein
VEDADNGDEIGALFFGVTLGQQVLGYVKVGNYKPGNFLTYFGVSLKTKLGNIISIILVVRNIFEHF